MSVLFGVWQFSKGLTVKSLLPRMSDAIKADHDIRYHSEWQQVGFGTLIRYNTPESLLEKGPVFFAGKEIFFLAQGRLDNRNQLSELLGFCNAFDKPDSYFMLYAYLKWGKECVRYFRGDWSFAAFDHRAQELFVGRDPLGYTSLYYYSDLTGFYFSSSIKALLELPSYHKKLNELHFVRNLTLWEQKKSENDTYFENIFSLSPGHTLSVKDYKVTVEKYWHPGSCSTRTYKNMQRYADEFGTIFNSAIKARLRSNKPVASMLSGGLDSSTVSYTAAEILKPISSLTTFSHIPHYTEELKSEKFRRHKILDESPNINKVVQASGNIKAQFLDSGNQRLLGSLHEFLEIYSGPIHGASNVYWLIDLYRTSVKQGFGTLLSGEGGNGSASFAGADYLLPFSFSRLISSPYLFMRRQVARPVKAYLSDLLRKKPLISAMERYATQVFLVSPILEKYKIVEDIRENNRHFNPVVNDIRQVKELFVDLYNTRSVAGAVMGDHFGFELRDPFTDQDLMEYFFSIPNEAFFDDHYNNRMLVKRMMRGKIPDDVLFAKKGGLQSSDIVYRVRDQAAEIKEAITIVAKSRAVNHYFDTKELSRTFEISLTKQNVEPYEMQRVLKVLQFALFLQQHFD